MPLSQPQISKLPKTTCPVHMWSTCPRSYFSADKIFWTGHMFAHFDYLNKKRFQPKISPKIQPTVTAKLARLHGIASLSAHIKIVDRPRQSAPFLSGAAVSFMQDGTQNRPSVFVQLASSSDAERVFSTMNDTYHGRSWGTCLPYVHPVPSFNCTSCWQ